MAITLSPKAAGEVVRYTWAPALADGDSLASYTLTESGCTIVSDEIDGVEIAFFVSGGTAGAVATIAASAATADGEDLEDTLYLPIRATTNAAGNTAQDACSFALRKVVGVGETATAGEYDDALEQLNDMLAMWRIDGLDIGLAARLELTDTIDVADEYLAAIKFNLRLACHSLYGVENTAHDVQMAEASKRLIANRLFSLADLAMDRTMTGRISTETLD